MITSKMANYGVARCLVDSDSFVTVSSCEAFKKMGFKERNLKLIASTLFRFTKEPIYLKGKESVLAHYFKRRKKYNKDG